MIVRLQLLRKMPIFSRYSYTTSAENGDSDDSVNRYGRSLVVGVYDDAKS